MEPAVRDIIIKSALGGVVIALLLSLGRLKQFTAVGVLITVPTISLYTFWMIGTQYGADKMRQSVYAGIWSAFPWMIYLLVVYLLAGRVPVWKALAGGVLTYLILNFGVWLTLRGHS